MVDLGPMPIRPGCRGGRVEKFDYDGLRNDKFKDNYLGADVKLNPRWYNKTNGSTEEQKLREERQMLQRQEEELMMQELGLKPKTFDPKKPMHQLDELEIKELTKRGVESDEEPDALNDRMKEANRMGGVGFAPTAVHVGHERKEEDLIAAKLAAKQQRQRMQDRLDALEPEEVEGREMTKEEKKALKSQQKEIKRAFKDERRAAKEQRREIKALLKVARKSNKKHTRVKAESPSPPHSHAVRGEEGDAEIRRWKDQMAAREREREVRAGAKTGRPVAGVQGGRREGGQREGAGAGREREREGERERKGRGEDRGRRDVSRERGRGRGDSRERERGRKDSRERGRGRKDSRERERSRSREASSERKRRRSRERSRSRDLKRGRSGARSRSPPRRRRRHDSDSD